MEQGGGRTLFPLCTILLGDDAESTSTRGARKPCRSPLLFLKHDRKATKCFRSSRSEARHLISSVLFPQPCGGLAWPLAQLIQPLAEDGSVDCGDRITQMTREMAEEVFLMAQSLRSGGPGLVLGLQAAAVGGRVPPSGRHGGHAWHLAFPMPTMHVTSPSPLLGSVTMVLSYPTREDNLPGTAIS